ncbi:MAG: hypothetical protein EA447_05815 [Nitrosopumilus sp.]|nr:MAG: hypothetical protein EA447_05815 [Nitrosopumilus sp.]
MSQEDKFKNIAREFVNSQNRFAEELLELQLETAKLLEQKQYEDSLEYKVQLTLLDDDLNDYKKFYEIATKTLKQNHEESTRLLKEQQEESTRLLKEQQEESTRLLKELFHAKDTKY